MPRDGGGEHTEAQALDLLLKRVRADIGAAVNSCDPTPTDDGSWGLPDGGFQILGHAGWILDRVLEGEPCKKVLERMPECAIPPEWMDENQ